MDLVGWLHFLRLALRIAFARNASYLILGSLLFSGYSLVCLNFDGDGVFFPILLLFECWVALITPLFFSKK